MQKNDKYKVRKYLVCLFMGMKGFVGLKTQNKFIIVFQGRKLLGHFVES